MVILNKTYNILLPKITYVYSFSDDDCDILPEIDNVKKNEILVIVDEIAHKLSMDTADVQILDNITGYRELGYMMHHSMMNIEQYKIIFLMLGRYDMMTSNADYSDRFKYALDIMRERNSKAIFVLCPCIISPADDHSERILGQGRGVAMSLFTHENIGFAFCRANKEIMHNNQPINSYFNFRGDLTDEGIELIKIEITKKLQDGTLFHLYKFMENM